MNNNLRSFGVFALVIAVAIASVVFFVRQITHGPGVTGPATPTPIARAAIAEVRLTVQGPIVANEQYVSEILDVTANQRNLTANVTYQNQLVTSQTFGNNADAFNQFLGALLDAGYIQVARGRNIAARPGSTCPQGLRFTYETAGQDGNTLTSLWASSCATNNQSFNGNGSLVNQLFKAQFPNFSSLTSQFPVLQPLQW